MLTGHAAAYPLVSGLFVALPLLRRRGRTVPAACNTDSFVSGVQQAAMGRVDAWDVSSRNASDEVTLELPRIFHNRYMVGEELGRGGFGVVRVVTDRLTGERLACKSIPKRPPGSHVTAGQQARHLETIQRELQVRARSGARRNSGTSTPLEAVVQQ